MDRKAGLLGYLVMTIVVTLGTLVLLTGCQKDKPAAGTKATPTKSQAATPMPMKHEATPAPVAQVAQTGEQTTCPVTGDPIDKNVFIEYQGKRVYFCCASCVDMFKADPEKYISKLPQSAK